MQNRNEQEEWQSIRDEAYLLNTLGDGKPGFHYHADNVLRNCEYRLTRLNFESSQSGGLFSQSKLGIQQYSDILHRIRDLIDAYTALENLSKPENFVYTLGLEAANNNLYYARVTFIDFQDKWKNLRAKLSEVESEKVGSSFNSNLKEFYRMVKWIQVNLRIGSDTLNMRFSDINEKITNHNITISNNRTQPR